MLWNSPAWVACTLFLANRAIEKPSSSMAALTRPRRSTSTTLRPDSWLPAEPAIGADLASITVEQRFFRSNDGMRVPMFIARRKKVGRTGPDPSDRVRRIWAQHATGLFRDADAMDIAGGAVAFANIRGRRRVRRGLARGRARPEEANSFDDMIAAAEYLHVSKDGAAKWHCDLRRFQLAA